MAILEKLMFYGDRNRKIWVFDTFEGMTSPEDHDVDLNNNTASVLLDKSLSGIDFRCISHYEEATANIMGTGYPAEKLEFIKGDVVTTLPTVNIANIALFDLYRGKGVGDGKKSLAFRVLLQDTEKTLIDSEIESSVACLAEVLQRQGAQFTYFANREIPLGRNRWKISTKLGVFHDNLSIIPQLYRVSNHLLASAIQQPADYPTIPRRPASPRGCQTPRSQRSYCKLYSTHAMPYALGGVGSTASAFPNQP